MLSRAGLVSPPIRQASLREVKEKAWQSNESAAQYREGVSRPSIGMQTEMETALRFTSGRVLDVGAGTGRFSSFLARNGRDVFALDISAEMLKEAAADCPPSVDFMRGSAFKLPFANDTFDSVVSFWLMVHFKEWPTILSEMIRVCKQGGRLVFEVNNPLNYEKGCQIAPGAAFADKVNGAAEFTVFVRPKEIDSVAEKIGASTIWSRYYDLFNDNFIAQAVQAANYGTWLSSINELLTKDECRQFWRDFEAEVLRTLPTFVARKQLFVLQKGRAILDLDRNVSGRRTALDSQENADIAKSYQMVFDTFSKYCPSLTEKVHL